MTQPSSHPEIPETKALYLWPDVNEERVDLPNYANQLVFRWQPRNATKEAVNVLSVTGGGVSPDIILQEVWASFKTRFQPVMQEDMKLAGLTYYVWGGEGFTPFEYGNSWEGTGGSTSSSPNVAHLIRKVTDASGRKGQGRWYLPGVPEAAVDSGGNLTAGHMAAVQNAFNGFLEDLLVSEGGAIKPCVLRHHARQWTRLSGECVRP